MFRLMYALNKGRRSGQEEGYVSSADVRAYVHRKQQKGGRAHHALPHDRYPHSGD